MQTINLHFTKILLLVLLLSSCQGLKTRNEINQTTKSTQVTSTSNVNSSANNKIEQNNQSPSVNQTETAEPSSQEEFVTPQKNITSSTKIPKFGVILSGGGVRTWGHIAVLKELNKHRFPIVAIAGVEWGSLMAAVYAHEQSSNEVEWEFSKFRSLEEWPKFIDQVFSKLSTFDFKSNFVCPSLNLKTRNAFLLNRGPVRNFITYCLPSAGVISPVGSSVAYFNDLNAIINHLKLSGANKIILVNVLATNQQSSFFDSVESTENQIWSNYAASLKKQAIINDYIEIDLSDFKINDFDRRGEVLEKATSLSYDQVRKVADKYKL